MKKVKAPLDKNNVFMFSSVHNWMDTRILKKEAFSLIKSGKNIEFYAIGNQEEAPFIEGIQFHLMKKGKKWSRPFKWFFLMKKALRSGAKYYHFHDAELLCLAPLIRKQKPNAVIIYDMHEYFAAQISTKDWLPAPVRRPISKLVCVLEKKLMRYCDGVIFAETSYKQYFTEYKGLTKDILNYPLPIEQNKMQKEEVFTLIYVGDITEDRNIMGMIEVAKIVMERGRFQFQLKLIGPIAQSLKDKVNRKIIEYCLEGYIFWYGRIPYEDIWNHYFSADVGLCLLKPIPNYKNSLATKLFEYMAAGLPIIASDFPDWKSLLIENNCGLFANPLDSNEIAQLIEHLEHDKVLAQKLGTNGREAFETQFSWKSEEEKLAVFYRFLEKVRIGE